MLDYSMSTSHSDEMDMRGGQYECVRCGEQFSGAEIDMRGGEIKCIHCGYRVITKVKAPVVRRIKAI